MNSSGRSEDVLNTKLARVQKKGQVTLLVVGARRLREEEDVVL